jgi:putative ABC transport system permease protein
MVLRNTARQPWRTTLSAVGVSLGVAVLVVGLFFLDTIQILLRVQFETVQRQDVTVAFTRPVSASALFALRRLPGVTEVEPLRAVPVEMRVGPRARQTAIMGLPSEPALNRVIDQAGRAVSLPPAGLVMSRTLADVLGVSAGDMVEVELLEGRRQVRAVPVARLVEEYMGASVYMERSALARLVGEDASLSGAFLRVDSARETELYRELKALPAVAGVSLKRSAVESFRETIAQNMLVLVFFNVAFASIIAYGVVYNAARIALSERSRDLASLRVLGFSRAEVSTILLGELGVIVALAIPIGLSIGQGLSAAIIWATESELYRFPLIVTPRTRLFAVGVVLAAATISGLIVRRLVDRLDLIGVLKTKE